MSDKFFRPLVLLWCTDVYPRAVQWVTDNSLALVNQFLYKVCCVEESIFRNLGKGSLLDEIDAGIGIVVVFRLLNEPFDISAIEVEDAERNADVIRHGCYRHLRIMTLEMKEKVLIVDVGKKVGIHYKYGVVTEIIYILDTADST